MYCSNALLNPVLMNVKFVLSLGLFRQDIPHRRMFFRRFICKAKIVNHTDIMLK